MQLAIIMTDVLLDMSGSTYVELIHVFEALCNLYIVCLIFVYFVKQIVYRVVDNDVMHTQ